MAFPLLAVTAGPSVIGHGAQALFTRGSVNSALKKYDKELALRNQSSYRPVKGV